jgi:hypothetical protein
VSWKDWVGPAVGLAGLMFAIYVYIQNRRPKRLQYEIPTDQAIVSHSRYTRWTDLSVRFGNRDLKRPRVVVVRVTNTGKVEVRDNDFDEPLAVSATGNAEIIAATIALRRKGAESSLEIEPTSLGATEVVAPKVVLNEGEWLEFRLLVEGDREAINLRGHAAGFSLTPYSPRSRGFTSYQWSSILAVLLVVSTIVLGLITPFEKETIAVPNVVGKPIQQAVTQINDAGLKLGTVNHVRSSAEASSVISESPAAGKEVTKDTTITLVVSDGP